MQVIWIVIRLRLIKSDFNHVIGSRLKTVGGVGTRNWSYPNRPNEMHRRRLISRYSRSGFLRVFTASLQMMSVRWGDKESRVWFNLIIWFGSIHWEFGVSFYLFNFFKEIVQRFFKEVDLIFSLFVSFQFDIFCFLLTFRGKTRNLNNMKIFPAHLIVFSQSNSPADWLICMHLHW